MTTTAADSETDAKAKRAGGLCAALGDKTLLGWLHDMALIREFEVRTMQAYSNARIGGFCHVYIGEEACAVGTLACVNHDDPVITAYRDHGHALARGMDPGVCMAEMFGRITGCAKGKGGSMHMFDKANSLFGGHGIVGAQTPIGAGLAFAAKYEHDVLGAGKKKLVLCYLGDGALNQGAFHEAMNLAGVLGLPVIYIVENNGYSMGTAITRGTTMAANLAKKPAAYGIEGASIDGMDILNIYDKFKPIADACRQEVRPAFVEIKTYRYYGHSTSDPQKYRTKAEVEKVKKRDSIDLLAKHLTDERGALSKDDYKAMLKEIRQTVRNAVKFADASAPTEPGAELYTDVYANPQPGLSPVREYPKGPANPPS